MDKQSFKRICDVAYERGNPVLPDSAYDALFGANASAMDSLQPGKKRTLPVFMGSLDKVKGDTMLRLWLAKFGSASSVVITPKLDGMSALLSFGDGLTGPSLTSRGNGREGSVLDKLLPWISDWGRLYTDEAVLALSNGRETHVRGELIMKKDVFKARYATTYKNARNLVAGQVSKKCAFGNGDNFYADISFVPYELIHTPGPNVRPSTQLRELYSDPVMQTNGFVWTTVPTNALTVDYLEELYAKFSEELNYAIDGLVVSLDHAYESACSGNPYTTFAFKPQETESAEADVVSVTWNVSKWGALKPVVNIVPVQMEDVVISNVSGHNAAYIRSNNIGAGAKIKVVRAGKVIPYIADVLSPGPEPAVLPEGVWQGAEIYIAKDGAQAQAVSASNGGLADDLLITRLVFCLKTLRVPFLGPHTVKRLVTKCGYKTLVSLLDCTEVCLLTEFRPCTAQSILKSIDELKSRPLLASTLVAASGVLGRGISEAKAAKLLRAVDHTRVPDMKEIRAIAGFAAKTSNTVHENFQDMIDLVEACRLHGLQVVWNE
jgi:NAD-dependent DNA ligase